MSSRARVVLVCSGLGLGGTEKGLVIHALRLDRDRFDPRVVTIHERGPRETELLEGHVPLDCAQGDAERLKQLLDGADVVHVFRQGVADPTVPLAARRAGARVLIETNIFGAVDHSEHEAYFDCHLFLSQMCLARHRAWLGSPAGYEDRHRVLYLPADAARLEKLSPGRRAAKAALGFDPDRPVVGRHGRAANLKWRNLLIDMMPRLVELVPGVQFLLVGVPPAKQRRLGRLGLLDHVRVMEPAAAEDKLAVLYSACDVVINAAVIGESQGLAMAEAMALGIPAVTCSTPWADNAQVELVDHGHGGWIANHPQEFGEAVADLLGDDNKRAAFGAHAQQKMRALLDPVVLTRRLESLYAHHLDRVQGPLSWIPDSADAQKFEAEYNARATASFRPLTRRERLAVGAARERDRMERLAANASMVDRDSMRALGRALRRVRRDRMAS